MSQSGTYEAGNPGIVDIQFLTGNTTLGGLPLPVGPDGAGNIDIVGDDLLINVDGNPATNTLTISLINSVTNDIQTVGAVTGDLVTIAMPDSTSALSLFAEIIAAEDNYAQAGSYFLVGGARRAGAGAILPTGGDASLSNATDFAAASVSVAVSGNNVIVQVTGEALTTINWQAIVRYQIIDL